MPPCPTCCATRESILKAGRRKWSRLATSSLNASRKGLSTSSPLAGTFSKDSHDFPSPRHGALTLLHKTTKLLPVALDAKHASGFPRTLELWDGVLSQAYEDLSTAEARPVRLVVYGLDEWSGARELVTALLADPLSSNPTVTKALNERWKDLNRERLYISYGSQLEAGQASLQLPSPYLSQFPVPIEIIELPIPKQSKGTSITQILEDHTILEADIPIFVCNPLVTPLSTIPMAELPHNAIFIFSTSMPQVDLNAILSKHGSSSSISRLPFALKPSQFIAVDPQRAAKAVRILQNEPNSLSAIQQFQDDVVGSHISLVTKTLKYKLSQNGTNSARMKIALARICDALDASSASVRRTRYELDQAFIDANNLRKSIEEIKVKIEGAIFQQQEDSQTIKAAENEVIDAVKQAEKEMKQVMDRLTWWRMISRVDEISDIVATSVSRTWCRDLEKRLILHTGRLSALQRDFAKSGTELLSRHPILSTAVLQNTLLQLKASPDYRLTPDSLTKPIYLRRNQIIDYPTARLHVAGQRALLGMAGGVLSGAGIGWAGWLGWMVGSGEGLLQFTGMDASTAIGVGMLSAVAGIRWGVGKWEKAKKRWWQDWQRVGQGLDRDLKDTLDETICHKVVIVAETASTGVSNLVQKREEELVQVSQDLEGLKTDLDRIMTKVDLKP